MFVANVNSKSRYSFHKNMVVDFDVITDKGKDEVLGHEVDDVCYKGKF